MKFPVVSLLPLKFLAALALLLQPLLAAPAEPPPWERELQARLGTDLEETEKALSESPDSMARLSEAGNASLFLEKYGDAVKYFHRMVEIDPAQDARHWRLGIAYYFHGQWALSAQQFAKYHAYDGHDRENGLWKFLGEARAQDLAHARAHMLPYTEFDREPFPALYDLFAGKTTTAQFEQDLETRQQTQNPRVMFFALYYGGLYEELLGHHPVAEAKVASAVALFTPESAETEGPGYMWKVARVHAHWLKSNPLPNTPKPTP